MRCTGLSAGGGPTKPTLTMMFKKWESWDLYPIHARTQEDFLQKKEWTGWRPKTNAQKLDFKKKVMENGEEKIDENLVTKQETVEVAAGKVAH